MIFSLYYHIIKKTSPTSEEKRSTLRKNKSNESTSKEKQTILNRISNIHENNRESIHEIPVDYVRIKSMSKPKTYIGSGIISDDTLDISSNTATGKVISIMYLILIYIVRNYTVRCMCYFLEWFNYDKQAQA